MALPTVVKETGKSLIFEILSQIDTSAAGPRLGKLIVSERKELETPNFFAITSRGVIPHMTPDVIASQSGLGGVHIAIEDFIELATTSRLPPLLSTPGPSPLHTFNSLPVPLISLFAPRRTPAVASPNGNSSSAISIFTSTGFQPLPNQDYVSYINTLRPDIAISLADVSYNGKSGAKRVAKMGDRTETWLSTLLSEKSPSQAVFAPVLPIDYLDQAEYLDHVSNELVEGVAGLAFYNSNLLPGIPATTYLDQLPRLSLDEPSSPRQILRQVSLGMDLFTIPFIGFATDAGIALSFAFPKPQPSSNGAETTPRPETEGLSSLLPLGIDTWSPGLATNLSPLSENCTCYTCTSHHLAFIQHLLSAKEMLGWVLLQVHNHQVLSTFFAAIRESICKGTFEEDCRTFETVYESELPAKSGQGPRIRGYHFKSEGPAQNAAETKGKAKKGEGRRNQPAWAADLGSKGEKKLENEVVKLEESAGALEQKGFAEKAGMSRAEQAAMNRK